MLANRRCNRTAAGLIRAGGFFCECMGVETVASVGVLCDMAGGRGRDHKISMAPSNA